MISNEKPSRHLCVCVSIADNEEDGCARRIELVVKAGQAPDIEISGALQNAKVQCAEHDTPVIEEAERALVDSEDVFCG